jgi:hypothetical protein
MPQSILGASAVIMRTYAEHRHGGACYHDRVRSVWVLAVAVALLATTGVERPGGVRLASGEPYIVDIRAHTQLSLTSIKTLDPTSVEVVGYLRDKLTGQGIANQEVTLGLGTERKLVMTGPDGGFTIVMPAAPGTVQVSLDFHGDDRLEKADPLSVTTDPMRSPVALELVKTIDDPAGARLRITTTSEGKDILLPVALDIASVTGATWKKLRNVNSGEEFVLSRREAGGAGTYRLRAQYAGDDAHQSALAVVTIEMASSSQTTMSVSSTKLAFEDDLVVTGTVTDDDKQPLKSAVTLMSGDRRLAQGTTNASGAYRFEIEAELIGHGQFGIQVQAEPGVSFLKGSRSNPEVIRIAPPQPVPVAYTIAAFAATALAAGGFFAARSKPWRRLRRPQSPAEVPSERGELEVPHGGLVTAKPGVVATLRRPSDDGFAGVVRETVRGRPVEDAVVVLTLGDRERTTRTSADGSFAIEKLEAGEWRAEASSTGHITERFTVSIPHRGELRGVRVDLVPVRERVFQLYRRAAEPVLPEARLWGIWSPRQIVDHVRSKRQSPALAELTDFVEEIYFSGRLAEETVLPQAEGRVTRALDERAGVR